MRARRHGGFTLIELLVVITIITILAAILFPVFSQSQAKAKSANCQSNLSQIGKALQMYRQDNEGNSPLAFMPNNPVGQQTWYALLYPYIKDYKVFICPGAQDLNSVQGNADGSLASGLAGSTIGYYYNSAYYNTAGLNFQPADIPVTGPGGDYLDSPPAAISDSRVKDPTGTLTVLDGPNVALVDPKVMDPNARAYNFNSPEAATYLHDTVLQVGPQGASPNPDNALMSYRHNNLNNCLYYDGHVRSETLASILEPYGGLTANASASGRLTRWTIESDTRGSLQ